MGVNSQKETGCGRPLLVGDELHAQDSGSQLFVDKRRGATQALDHGRADTSTASTNTAALQPECSRQRQDSCFHCAHISSTPMSTPTFPLTQKSLPAFGGVLFVVLDVPGRK